MKLLIILIIIISLSGCGIYSLNYFVMPDDLEFLEVIENLDTPLKISKYMQENFTYKIHLLKTISPYILWKIGEGDCNDFSAFGTFVANYHGYKTYQIEIKLKNTLYTHWLGVYTEGNYSFTDNKNYFYGYSTFREIVEKSCKNIIYKEWIKYKVYDYEMNIIESGNFI